ncbi:ABC transporter permease [Propionicimonas sp.]|uniref:ABC transporter permease n=1 Tax=Propionicimonas sp. TaxID=1955623 RepID=UPI0017AF82EC|nr:ABC transporter permease [Propionicimonas sp.]MBU3975871.1 ABC transporter permease [Actinomycetota bacterium]MBA3022142.1 ABC transporter [Propionicimonas sp.]MBU3987421.1 ABC transporter permease [Actinomycetota bacterium]MBU4006634.1 ABC transporter permease [Actinomycetota bacterium]MBU4065239.1 ABC transporter permease [Actinomycetota bacterium]
MTTKLIRIRPGVGAWMAANSSGNAGAVIGRGFKVIRNQNWMIIVSGFFEPVFYLLSMGIGLGALIGTVTGPGGHQISYAAYIAPALLATSAMNGAIYDSTWNVFFKLRFAKLYEGMLATSLGPLDVAAGEIFMALFRGFLYAVGFTVVIASMGLTTSWWALAMIPVALLIALGFAAIGMALTSYFTTFQQMDWINIALLPMFMFSATLFPIEAFPEVMQWFIMTLPLWHGVELMRQLSVGHWDASTAVHLTYFVAMSVLGVAFATRRLRTLFLR